MSQELLKYTMFHRVLFPELTETLEDDKAEDLVLRKVRRLQLAPTIALSELPIIVFDFETTGLDPREDRIVEIGAQRLINFEVVAEFSTLVKPDVTMSERAMQVSGITMEMLKDQPRISEALPRFLEFLEGGLLVAHNAEFDMSFLRAESSRLGYELQWPCFCSLKLARQLLPTLESKGLDALAVHYGLQFEARHRSVGDVKVTSVVLKRMLSEASPPIKIWGELAAVAVN